MAETADTTAPVPAVAAPVVPAPVPATATPAAKSAAQLATETVVDLAALAIVALLAVKGKVDGNVALALIALLAGVRLSDLVTLRGGAPTAGGLAGGLAGAVFSLFQHRAHAGYVEVPSFAAHGVARLVARLRYALPALAIVATLAGCPAYVRPPCGQPGVYSCVRDQPHVCSPSGGLTAIGDEPCGRQGNVCAVSDAGVAFCAPSDGGAQ